MALTIDDRGTNNRVAIPAALDDNFHGTIVISGNNNEISIEPSGYIVSIYIELASDCKLSIAGSMYACGLSIFQHPSTTIVIGKEVGFSDRVRLMAHEPGQITIGNSCLFGPIVDVMNSDMHSIIDLATGERINHAEDVSIGDHVWIAQRVTVLKGSTIGRGSIIGAGSMLNSAIPENSLAAGCPARVLRSGVTWNFNLL